MSNHRQWADGPILDIMDRHDRLLADRAAAVELVRELRDAAYRLEREISSRFGHDDDMIPQTREPIEGMRAALASADVFLRGERSSGAEVARLADDVASRIWTDVLKARGDYAGWFEDKRAAAALILEALRRYPDKPQEAKP
jgi:hypothetical protein